MGELRPGGDGERGLGLFGVAPVPRHDRVGANAHFPDLADGVAQLDLHTCVGTADADDRIFLGIIKRGAEPDARPRAEAVTDALARHIRGIQ